jgi:Zn finger protein HypA/HybF involved in hydrogenase expression
MKITKKLKNILILIPFCIYVIYILGCIIIQSSTKFWDSTTGVIDENYYYNYTVNQKQYKNYVIQIRPMFFGNQVIDEHYERFKYWKGTEVKVYYFNKFPSVSVLINGPNDADLLGWSIALVCIFFIFITIKLSYGSSEKTNNVLKSLGFRIAYSNQSFGQYLIKNASPDFSNFSLKANDEGDASFIRCPDAANEINGRFIHLTRKSLYNPYKQVIELTFETSWTFYFNLRHKNIRGVVNTSLNTAKKRIKYEEKRDIYLRMRFDSNAKEDARKRKNYRGKIDYKLRPELINFDNFDSGNADFDNFFKIRLGSILVSEAIASDKTGRIIENLKKWKNIFYDIIVDEKIHIRINPTKIKGWPFYYLSTFSKIFPKLLNDCLKFVETLDDLVSAYEPEYKNYDKEMKCAAVFAAKKCKKCKNPIPINGIFEKYICPACNTKNTLDYQYDWSWVLYEPYRNFEIKNPKIHIDTLSDLDFNHIKWKPENPRCPKCDTLIPNQIIKNQPLDKYSEFLCPYCQSINFSFPPPDWVKEISPFIALIFNAEQEQSKNIIAGKLSVGYWFYRKKRI